MTSTRTVALVGRPNVGKSRLFNRLAGRRIAIVHDQPGVTRDVNAVEVAAASGTYSLLDTGGIGLEDARSPRQIVEAAEEQVFIAVEASDLICFVVDAKDGLTALDEIIATRLRKSGKKLILVINKVDNPEDTSPVGEFSRLGMGNGICVSAEHGNNEDALRGAIERNLPPAVEEAPASTERRTRICFIGRPNVGKSSLCNALFKSERLVVSEVPGTTRDSIELDLDYTQNDGTVLPFRLVDTAGLRRRANIASPVEYFSAVRSEQAIESADVALVVLDALDGVTRQEQALLGKSLSFAPGVAVIVNKWDHAVEAIREGRLHQYKNEREYREAFEKSIREMLFFLPDSPIVFVSALSGLGIDRILKMASGLRERMDSKIPTASINRLLEKLFERRSPKMKNGRRFKAYYALQTGNRPIKIRIFCNSIEKLEDNYRRYLEHGFIEEFDLRGCPLRFELIGKPPRERKN